MKADESDNYAGSWGGRLSAGLGFHFLGGARNRKINFKKLGFRLGSDVAMLSCTGGILSKQDPRRGYHLWATSSCTSGTE
jgi:hypothetical protein